MHNVFRVIIIKTRKDGKALYRLVSVDIDDSFLNSDCTISKANLQAVQDLKKAGVRIIINTGRTRFGATEIMKTLGLENQINICINGAVMIYPDKRDDRLLGKFERDEYLELTKKAREEGRPFLVFTTEGVKYEFTSKLLESHLKRFQLDREASVTDCSKISEACRVNVIKFDNSEREIDHLREICPENCRVTNNPFEDMVHYLPKGITKAVGLEILMRKYGIKKEEAASFGDQVVDTPMFDVTGLGVTLENGDGAAKEKADIIIPRTNNENAFAYLVYRYILKDDEKLKRI